MYTYLYSSLIYTLYNDKVTFFVLLGQKSTLSNKRIIIHVVCFLCFLNASSVIRKDFFFSHQWLPSYNNHLSLSLKQYLLLSLISNIYISFILFLPFFPPSPFLTSFSHYSIILLLL